MIEKIQRGQNTTAMYKGAIVISIFMAKNQDLRIDSTGPVGDIRKYPVLK